MEPEMITRLRNTAVSMRRHVLRLALNGGNTGVHVGPALSIVEILAALYLQVMRRTSDGRMHDKFILSKGHGALAYYIALHEAGLIGTDELNTYEKNGGDFPGQPVRNEKAGIDFSSGTLGLGLAYGAGLALGCRNKNEDRRIWVLLGDGELNEGSVWETAMFAAHQKLTNLVAIVDRNGMQSDGVSADVLSIAVEDMWRGFGWDVSTCDGHDVGALLHVMNAPTGTRPRVIVARTVKGKGISFMEGNNEWHHNRLTQEQYSRGCAELDAATIQ